jgi:hypothetical protein
VNRPPSGGRNLRASPHIPHAWGTVHYRGRDSENQFRRIIPINPIRQEGKFGTAVADLLFQREYKLRRSCLLSDEDVGHRAFIRGER